MNKMKDGTDSLINIVCPKTGICVEVKSYSIY